MGKHSVGKLEAVALSKKAEGWHNDGGGLYLFVRGTSRAWVFRYTGPDGNRRHMGLGSLAAVGLAEARRLAAEARQQVKHPMAPIDPVEARREAKTARRLAESRRRTFEQCAQACIEALTPEWKNAKHAAQWGSTLATYAYPVIGSFPVDQVGTAEVLRVLEPIWTTKTETASRLRGRMEKVLAWATTSKLRSGENPARWKGHLDTVLAKPGKVAKVEHHEALPYQQIGEFMADLRTRDGIGARAVEFAILTAARSGEVRGATWDEIDLANRVWTIPEGRMKAGKEHAIPLCDAAVKLLEALPREEGNPLVFLSAKPGRPISDMTLTAVLRRMERQEITVHGFRSTFRDWAGETTSFPREVIEHALAHQLKDKAEAAYARGTLFGKRRELMATWEKYCATVQKETANVVPMKRRKTGAA